MAASGSISSVILSRYAGALIDLAQEAKILDKVHADLSAFANMVEGSSELFMMVHSPMMSKTEQMAVLGEIAKKAKFQDLTLNFIGVLVQNRRLNVVLDIIRTAEKMIAERKGLVSVAVTTASALSEPQKKELQTKISASLGHDVILDIKIDPAILGGMIVTIGSQMIDDSVRRKLERLNALLIKGANTNTIQTLKEVV